MGDDAVFYALRAEAFAVGYVDRSEQGRTKLERLFEACTRECLLETLEAGWDVAAELVDASSIGDRLEGERLDAWQQLCAALLTTEACPWFGRLCDAWDVLGGAVAPEALARLVARLRETRVLPALDSAPDADADDLRFTELDAFLGRSADAGAWVVWSTR